jgi:large subunit ribosomal protein L27
MATKKAGGTAKNLRDSQPKYLGVKKGAGESVKVGQIIIRQRGTKIEAGPGAKVGRDHTIFAVRDGVVAFRAKRKVRFDGSVIKKRTVTVVGV